MRTDAALSAVPTARVIRDCGTVVDAVSADRTLNINQWLLDANLRGVHFVTKLEVAAVDATSFMADESDR